MKLKYILFIVIGVVSLGFALWILLLWTWNMDAANASAMLSLDGINRIDDFGSWASSYGDSMNMMVLVKIIKILACGIFTVTGLSFVSIGGCGLYEISKQKEIAYYDVQEEYAPVTEESAIPEIPYVGPSAEPAE